MPVLWPWCPAPEHTETLEWLTDLIETSSAEQRIALTHAPRQTLDYTFRFTHRQYERAKLLEKLGGGGSWYVPLWHERQRVSVSAGAGSVSVDTASTDYRADGFALLWDSDEACEVVEIDTVGPSSLTLTGTTESAYSNGFVAPVRIAHSPEGVDADHGPGSIIEASKSFTVYDTEDLADDSLYTTYRGYPVITDCPMVGSGSISERLVREVETVDNGIAAPFFDTVTDRLSRSLGMAWMPSTLADLWALRTWLHAIKGRQKAFWLADNTRGIVLTAPVSPSDTTLTIRAIGLDGVSETGDLLLGGTSRHQFTSVATSGSNEVLTLSGSAGVSAPAGTTACLLRLCRLAQDRIEFAHTYRGRDRNITSVIVTADEVPA